MLESFLSAASSSLSKAARRAAQRAGHAYACTARALSPGRLLARLRRRFYALPFYSLFLGGRTPTEIRGTVPDPRPGTAAKAAAIVAGRAPWGGGGELWQADARIDPVMGPNGFRWLADLRADDTDAARVRARTLIDDWIERHRRWSWPSWSSGVVAERLTHWLTSSGFLFTGSDEAFRRRFLSAIARQARHLLRAAADEEGAGVFLAAKGLAYAGLTLPHGAVFLSRALKLLEDATRRQIFADGGHVSRSPLVLFDALRQLVDIRAGLVAAGVEVPGFLQNAIDRIAPMVRAMRMGDGALALFNGGHEGDGALIDAVLVQAAVRSQPTLKAPMAGFQRIQALRTVLVMDTGQPPEPGFDPGCHAGTLSFELSVGRNRLVVNCGAHPFGPAEWREALRATAAHSTVTVGATNSTQLIEDAGAGLRRPRHVTVIRREDGGDTWLETSHDGYVRPFGLMHVRHLYVAADGEEVRGRDSLIGRPGESERQPFAVRFHLHPDVSASLVEGGQQVLLKLPSGQGWRFRASGGRIALEPGAYFGNHGPAAPDGSRPDPRRRSLQIVVEAGPENLEATVKWRFALEPKHGT